MGSPAFQTGIWGIQGHLSSMARDSKYTDLEQPLKTAGQTPPPPHNEIHQVDH